MKGSFLLELDTTAPQVQITAPNYTTTNALTEIFVQANEPVSEQEIYLIDGTGFRHDLIFTNEGSRLTGYVRLNQSGETIVTVHARVRDDVGNESDLVQKAINVREAVEVVMTTGQAARRLETGHERRHLKLDDAIRRLGTGSRKRGVGIHDTTEGGTT